MIILDLQETVIEFFSDENELAIAEQVFCYSLPSGYWTTAPDESFKVTFNVNTTGDRFDKERKLLVKCLDVDSKLEITGKFEDEEQDIYLIYEIVKKHNTAMVDLIKERLKPHVQKLDFHGFYELEKQQLASFKRGAENLKNFPPHEQKTDGQRESDNYMAGIRIGEGKNKIPDFGPDSNGMIRKIKTVTVKIQPPPPSSML